MDIQDVKNLKEKLQEINKEVYDYEERFSFGNMLPAAYIKESIDELTKSVKGLDSTLEQILYEIKYK